MGGGFGSELPVGVAVETKASENPYDPPTEVSAARNGSFSGSRGPLVCLAAALLVTLVFAAINAAEEELPSRFAIQVTLAAGISQLPGLILAVAALFSSKSGLRWLLFPAYFVAVTGLSMYTIYAFNGKVDAQDSAAHMHVIMFPIMHCFIAGFAYTLVAIPLLVDVLFGRRR